MLPSAKVGIYKQSGNGRDSYISNDNGGFCVEHHSHYQPNYTKTNGLFSSKLGTGSHITIYQRDGTGRDSYIYNTNGGFAASTFANSSSGVNFFSTLRNGIDPFHSNNKSSPGAKSKTREKQMNGSFWYKQKDIERINSCMRYQKSLCKRLAKPKDMSKSIDQNKVMLTKSLSSLRNYVDEGKQNNLKRLFKSNSNTENMERITKNLIKCKFDCNDSHLKIEENYLNQDCNKKSRNDYLNKSNSDVNKCDIAQKLQYATKTNGGQHSRTITDLNTRANCDKNLSLSRLIHESNSFNKMNTIGNQERNSGFKIREVIPNKSINVKQTLIDFKFNSKSIDNGSSQSKLLWNNLPSNFKQIEVIAKDSNKDSLQDRLIGLKKKFKETDFGRILLKNKLEKQRLEHYLQESESGEFNRYKHKNRFEPDFML